MIYWFVSNLTADAVDFRARANYFTNQKSATRRICNYARPHFYIP